MVVHRKRKPAPDRPRWLGDKMEASARSATPGNCPKCGAPTLTGQSDDAQFWTATVDALPLSDVLTEAVARAAGRMTYDAVTNRRETALRVRDVAHMKHASAYPVHADHVCNGEGVDLDVTPAPAAVQEGLWA